MNRANPDSVAKAKTALIQFVIGLIMTIGSLAFKSVIAFLISVVILGLGVKGFVNMFTERA